MMDSYEQFGKYLGPETHLAPTIRAKFAEQLELNIPRTKNEHFNLKKYVVRMK